MKACPKLSIVVAAAANGRGIGRNGALPWRLRNEMKYFKHLTCGAGGNRNAVVMGRKTWESIPAKFRPLADRLNVVLSNSLDPTAMPANVLVAKNLDEALSHAAEHSVEQVFVIGGESVYAEALSKGECETVYLTQVYGDFGDCDAHFPELPADAFRCRGNPDWAPAGRQREEGVEYEFLVYSRQQSADSNSSAGLSSRIAAAPVGSTGARHEEYQYLDMIRYILEHGNRKGDRTGTGTISTFGTSMRFSLRNNALPLLTTKRVFWRGVAEELLWFISGDTSAKTLQDKNIHIWDGNGSREFLDKLGLTDREEGDLGPVYGFQWRHFGAEYKTMHDNYRGQGVDQLTQLIQTIKTNPNDRRMILTAWNPAAFHLMALPPCHMFAQFYVANGELSCQMYQRSADMGLGVPFNIASYALLTRLLAHCTGLEAGEFVHVIGDCHVYSNHVEPLKEQLTREPRPFPTLKINTENRDIDGFSFSDFEVVDYTPHKTIKMEMAV